MAEQMVSNNEEGFGMIIDPEHNKAVPIESAIGKRVLKNYLECLKNGPESTKIVSTSMFYKKKPKQTSANARTSQKSNSSSKRSNASSRSSGKKQAGGKVVLGSIRGVCGICKKNVYSSQERVKSGGKYYHEACWKKVGGGQNSLLNKYK